MSKSTINFQDFSVITFHENSRDKSVLNIQDVQQRKNLESAIKNSGSQSIECLYSRLNTRFLTRKSTGILDNYPDFKIGKGSIKINNDDFVLTRGKGDNQGTTVESEIAVLLDSAYLNNHYAKIDIFKAENDLRNILISQYKFHKTDDEIYNIAGKEHVHIVPSLFNINDDLSFNTMDDCIISMIKILHKIVGKGLKLKNFPLRPYCQKLFVEKTLQIFEKEKSNNETVKVLWAAKPRFGKTHTTFSLIERMNSKKENSIKGKRVLIATFKVNVESEWCDALNHTDFSNFCFISLREGNDQNLNSYDEQNNVCLLNEDVYDPDVTYVYFVSMQCLQNSNEKRNLIKNINFDIIVFDEEHYGSETESSQNILDAFKTDYYLALSGTAFKSMHKYKKDHILKFDINDEIKSKQKWKQDHLKDCDLLNHEECHKKNDPYYGVPNLIVAIINLAYEMKQSNKRLINDGIYTEDENFVFDKLFAIDENFNWKNDNQVDLLLRMLSPELDYEPINICENKQINLINTREDRKRLDKFSPYRKMSINGKIIDSASRMHSMWRLPEGGVTFKLKGVLKKYFPNHEIINVSSSEYGKADYTDPTEYCNFIRECHDKNIPTITLTCGRFTTGITIPELGCVLLMDSGKSASEYFQTAYRCQSPWKNSKGEILKENCFVLDYNPTRCLQSFVTQILHDKYDEEYSDAHNLLKNTAKEWLDNIPIFELRSAHNNEFEVIKFDNLMTTFNEMYKSSATSFSLGNTLENLRIRPNNLNLNLIQILESLKSQKVIADAKSTKYMVNDQIPNTGKNYQNFSLSSQTQNLSNQENLSNKEKEKLINKIKLIMNNFPKILYIFLLEKTFNSYDEFIDLLNKNVSLLNLNLSIKPQDVFFQFLKINHSDFNNFITSNVIEKNQLDEIIKKCNKQFKDSVNADINL